MERSVVVATGTDETARDARSRCPADCLFEPWTEAVSRCGECGLGKTVAPVNCASAQDYQGLAESEQVVKKRYFWALYRRQLSRLHAGAVLDVGCADGLFLDVMRMCGWMTQGVEAFRREGANHENVIVEEFLLLDSQERYDLVTFIHSFEHMAAPAETLRKCHALLKSGGRLLLAVPNFSGAWSRLLGEGWPWLNTQDHHFHYTSDAIVRLLSQNGFQVVVLRTYSGFAPSAFEMYLTAKGVFQWPVIRWRPIRSVLFRLSSRLRRPVNWLVDRSGQGAELQVVARPV